MDIEEKVIRQLIKGELNTKDKESEIIHINLDFSNDWFLKKIIKKCILKSIKWCIFPIIEEQNNFNNYITNRIKKIEGKQNEHRH